MSSESSIYQKLREAQSELKAPKARQGRFGKSRSAEDILEASKPVLKKHDLTLVVSDEMIQLGDRYYVKATATVHADAGESISSSAHAWEGEIDRSLDSAQVTGKASSYARKYALGGLLAIDDTKDADRDEHPPVAPAKTETKKAVDPTLPTHNQLAQLKDITAKLDLDEHNTAEFFQDAIGKPRPTTNDDFKKSIEFGNTVLGDMEDRAKELGQSVDEGTPPVS